MEARPLDRPAHPETSRSICCRVGSSRFTVNRSLKNAVERNRMKRLLREAFRLTQLVITPGVDIVVSGRWQKEKEPRLTNLVEELQKLITDAGIGSIASPHEQNISDT